MATPPVDSNLTLQVVARLRPVLPSDLKFTLSPPLTASFARSTSRQRGVAPSPHVDDFKSIAGRASTRMHVVSPTTLHVDARPFHLDAVLPHVATQGDVSRAVPLAPHVAACIPCVTVVIGPRGSGRTYTLFGPTPNASALSRSDAVRLGLLPRALHAIFDRFAHVSRRELNVKLQCAHLQGERWMDASSNGRAVGSPTLARATVVTDVAHGLKLLHNAMESKYATGASATVVHVDVTFPLHVGSARASTTPLVFMDVCLPNASFTRLLANLPHSRATRGATWWGEAPLNAYMRSVLCAPTGGLRGHVALLCCCSTLDAHADASLTMLELATRVMGAEQAQQDADAAAPVGEGIQTLIAAQRSHIAALTERCAKLEASVEGAPPPAHRATDAIIAASADVQVTSPLRMADLHSNASPADRRAPEVEVGAALLRAAVSRAHVHTSAAPGVDVRVRDALARARSVVTRLEAHAVSDSRGTTPRSGASVAPSAGGSVIVLSAAPPPAAAAAVSVSSGSSSAHDRFSLTVPAGLPHTGPRAASASSSAWARDDASSQRFMGSSSSSSTGRMEVRVVSPPRGRTPRIFSYTSGALVDFSSSRSSPVSRTVLSTGGSRVPAVAASVEERVNLAAAPAPTATRGSRLDLPPAPTVQPALSSRIPAPVAAASVPAPAASHVAVPSPLAAAAPSVPPNATPSASAVASASQPKLVVPVASIPSPVTAHDAARIDVAHDAASMDALTAALAHTRETLARALQVVHRQLEPSSPTPLDLPPVSLLDVPELLADPTQVRDTTALAHALNSMMTPSAAATNRRHNADSVSVLQQQARPPAAAARPPATTAAAWDADLSTPSMSKRHHVALQPARSVDPPAPRGPPTSARPPPPRAAPVVVTSAATVHSAGTVASATATADVRQQAAAARVADPQGMAAVPVVTKRPAAPQAPPAAAPRIPLPATTTIATLDMPTDMAPPTTEAAASPVSPTPVAGTVRSRLAALSKVSQAAAMAPEAGGGAPVRIAPPPAPSTPAAISPSVPSPVPAAAAVSPTPRPPTRPSAPAMSPMPPSVANTSIAPASVSASPAESPPASQPVTATARRQQLAAIAAARAGTSAAAPQPAPPVAAPRPPPPKLASAMSVPVLPVSVSSPTSSPASIPGPTSPRPPQRSQRLLPSPAARANGTSLASPPSAAVSPRPPARPPKDAPLSSIVSPPRTPRAPPSAPSSMLPVAPPIPAVAAQPPPPRTLPGRMATAVAADHARTAGIPSPPRIPVPPRPVPPPLRKG